MLAFAFLGGVLNSQLPALSESIESTTSVINQIATSTEMSSEFRAFYLLSLARSYLNGGDRTTVEQQFTPDLNLSRSSRLLRKGWEPLLVPWAEQLSSEGRFTGSIPHEDLVLADAATQKAVIQLDSVSDPFAKLNMYFIASQIFQKSGNTAGVRKCNKAVEDAIAVCEGRPSSGEDQIKAVASILNLMAFGIIPAHIPDQEFRVRPSEVEPFTKQDFAVSEKLKLRALALVDRLPSDSDLRRRGHRDLALWYMQLGKGELAEKQKQALFELVGTSDDRLLYPQRGGCGHLVWWQTKPVNFMVECGMG